METYQKGNKALFVLAGFLTVLSLALTISVLFLPVTRRDRFAFYLEQADTALSQGHIKAAERALLTASRYSHDKRHWFRILKRAELAARKSGQYLVFKRLARRAVQDIRGNEDLWSFYVYGLLRSGDLEAAKDALKHLKDKQYDMLRAEVLMRNENSKYTNTPQEPDPEMRALKGELRKSRDPVFFEYIGRIGLKPQLLFNASLLYMRSGQGSRILPLLPLLSGKDIPLKGAGLLAYDTGQTALAADFLATHNAVLNEKNEQDWETVQLLADCQFQLYDQERDPALSEKATRNYTAAASSTDERRWISMLNLSLLKSRSGAIKGSFAIARDLLDQYSYQKEVVYFFTEHFHQDYPVIVERIINAYLDENPDDPEILFLKYRYLAHGFSPEVFKAGLWSMYNSHPDSEVMARYLLWYLIGSQQLHESRILLERINHTLKDTPWLASYQAVQLAKEGHQDEAAAIFLELSKSDADWMTLFNLAVINYCQQDWVAALERLNTVVLLINNEKGMNPEKRRAALSDAYSLMGFVHWIQGDYIKAGYYLDSAVAQHEGRNLVKELKTRVMNPSVGNE